MAFRWIILFALLGLLKVRVAGKMESKAESNLEKKNSSLFGGSKASHQERDVWGKYCESGWYSFGEMCYKAEGMKRKEWLPWDKAEEVCVEEGGHLVAIHSAELNEFLVMHLLLNIETHVWIGLHDRKNEADYKWTDETTVGYTNWQKNEPSGKGGHDSEEDCGEMAFSLMTPVLGLWNDLNCGDRRPFICQKAKVSGIEEPANDPKRCGSQDDGFRLLKSCYFHVNAKKNWEEAEEHCSNRYHGHLAAITHYNVQIFLDYLLVNYSTAAMWIGMRLSPGKVAMKWSSGWYLVYSNWRENVTKNDVSHRYCAVMLEKGKWSTASCDNEYEFICQESSEIAPKLVETDNEVGVSCPTESKEWIDLGGQFCYIFKPTTYCSWYEANFRCELNGGTLASIHSTAEHRSLEQFLRHKAFYFHIGFYRKPKSLNDTFIWADGTPVDFIKWGHDEPNSKLEKCTELVVETMGWNDITCDTSRGFICSAKKVNHDMRNLTSGNQSGGCGNILSPTAILGIVICVLLVVTLIMVVIYNVIPRDGDRRRPRKSSLTTNRPPTIQNSTTRYRSGELVITEESECENIEY